MGMDSKKRQDESLAKPLLEVRDLHTSFSVEGETARAVDGVSFDVRAGEVLGLVGESGCEVLSF